MIRFLKMLAGNPPKPIKPDAGYFSYLLRRAALWPDGFKWNYEMHGCSAVDLFAIAWSEYPVILDELDVKVGAFSLSDLRRAEAIGITYIQHSAVFYQAGIRIIAGQTIFRNVSASLVADILDACRAGWDPYQGGASP